MKSKFNIIYEQIMSQLNSIRKGIRKGIKKVNQMTNQQFLAFLRDILPYFKNDKLDMDSVRITEKIDGNSIKISWYNNNLYFQNSHSGLVTWDKLPFKEQYKWIYDNFKSKFEFIHQKYDTDYKIIGEFIWCEGLIQNGKITPVGASYLANKFGSKGGLVIFDIKKILNDQLQDFDGEVQQNIMNDIINLSTEEFRFYDSNYITINNIEFKLDIQKLNKLLSTPEYNKVKYDKNKDQAVLKSIQQLRNQITTQLQTIINNTKGNFSDDGDMIQGIVMKLKNGNQYGMFSQGYKTMKAGYSKYRHLLDDLENEFLKNIFGYSQFMWIRKKYDLSKEKQYQKKFNDTFSDFVNNYGKLLNQLKNDNTIPKGTKNAQYELAKSHFEKLYPIKSYQDFKRIFVKKDE